MSIVTRINGRNFVLTECVTCGVEYVVPERVWDQQQKMGGEHCCINGHAQGWYKGDTEIDKIRRDRDRLKQQIAQHEDAVREWQEAAERNKRVATAAKGRITKLQKRAKNGVCPCCNRTFQNLASHMKTKHPAFEAEEPLKVIEGGKVA